MGRAGKWIAFSPFLLLTAKRGSVTRFLTLGGEFGFRCLLCGCVIAKGGRGWLAKVLKRECLEKKKKKIWSIQVTCWGTRKACQVAHALVPAAGRRVPDTRGLQPFCSVSRHSEGLWKCPDSFRNNLRYFVCGRKKGKRSGSRNWPQAAPLRVVPLACSMHCAVSQWGAGGRGGLQKLTTSSFSLSLSLFLSLPFSLSLSFFLSVPFPRWHQNNVLSLSNIHGV